MSAVSEQKQNQLDALAAEGSALIVTMDEFQLDVLRELDLTVGDAGKIAQAAFDSALRGKVSGVRDRAIKAKYMALSKNRVALAEECEKEIQLAVHLLKSIS